MQKDKIPSVGECQFWFGLLENCPTAILLVNRQGGISYANLRAAQVFGVDQSKMTSMTLYSIMDKLEDITRENGQGNKQYLQKVLSARLPAYDVRQSIHLRSGRRIDLSINATPFSLDPSSDEWMIISLDDISPHVRQENLLRRAHQDLERINQQMMRIMDIGNSLNVHLDLKSLVEKIIQIVYETAGFEIVTLYLRDQFTGEVRIATNQNGNGNAGTSVTYLEKGNIDQLLNDRPGSDDAVLVPCGMRGGRMSGILCVDQLRRGTRPKKGSLLTMNSLEIIANQAGVALENARLYELCQGELRGRKMSEEALTQECDDLEERIKRRTADLARLSGKLRVETDKRRRAQQQVWRINSELAQAYDATIAGWSRALDLRDKETEGHSQRVADMTLKLADKLGVKKEETIHLQRGAMLHDIGKVGIPDSILLKEGPLTNDEWQVMRRHPNYAYDLLQQIEHLRPALDIPYCHHERWNGDGYPRKLKGEQIPFGARIFAVADVWDALTSDRPYRKAWSKEKARDYISQEAGFLFDPMVVEAFSSVGLS